MVEQAISPQLTELANSFEKYWRMAVQIGRTKTNNIDDTQDIAQTALLKVLEKNAQFDQTRGSFGAWFRTICTNAAIDWQRSNSHRPTVSLDEVPQEAIIHPRTRSAEEEALTRIQLQEFIQTVKKMPPEQAIVYQLNRFGSMTVVEISQSLNLPLGTTKTRLRSGIRKLKAAYPNQGATP